MRVDASKGVRRVRVSFNPSGTEYVDRLKVMAAQFIDAVEAIDVVVPGTVDTVDGEVIRLKSLAQTSMEEAAMWAVKAATPLT